MSRPIVIFDIDGTLADNSHRAIYLNDMKYWDDTKSPPRPNWDKFNDPDLMAKDAPIVPMWDILYGLLLTGYTPIFITGRSGADRVLTSNWLLDRNCLIRGACTHMLQMRGFRLLMRTNGDYRKSSIVKEELFRLNIQMNGMRPSMAFDDSAEDCEMYRSLGILTNQVTSFEV